MGGTPGLEAIVRLPARYRMVSVTDLMGNRSAIATTRRRLRIPLDGNPAFVEGIRAKDARRLRLRAFRRDDPRAAVIGRLRHLLGRARPPEPPPRPRKFYLISAAGMPNFGDDAITRYWLGYLGRRFPGCTTYLDALDAPVASLLHPTATCVDFVWRLADWSAAESPIALRDALRSMLSSADPLPMRERQLLRLLRDVESVHFLGGGYINDLWAKNRNLIGVGSVLAELGPAHVFATGLGLQPIDDAGAAQIADLLAGFSHVDVRDEASHETLAAHLPAVARERLTCLGDDLLQVDSRELVSLAEGPPRMHVCIQNELFDGEQSADAVRRFVLSEVEAFRAEHPEGPVLCYEFRPRFDWVIHAFLSPHVANVTLVPFERVWADGMTFGKSDRLLSSRFHFQLLAAAAGLDGTALTWSGYYDEKFRSLRVLSRWRVLRLQEGRFVAVEFPSEPDRVRSVSELGQRKRDFVGTRLYPAP